MSVLTANEGAGLDLMAAGLMERYQRSWVLILPLPFMWTVTVTRRWERLTEEVVQRLARHHHLPRHWHFM